MPDQSTQINVVAAVRRLNDAQFACVVRWVLGDKGDLPHVDDVFEVTLGLREADGTPLPDLVTQATVEPQRYVMLDPPREPRPMDYAGAEGTRWLVAVRPTEPVNCTASHSVNLEGKAFGVCHLLEETEPSRLEWRTASMLHAEFTRQAPTSGPLALVNRSHLEETARTFAAALIRTGIRPLHLRQPLTQAYTDLVERAIHSPMNQSGAPPALLHLPGAGLGRQFAHAAMVLRAFSNRSFLERLDALVNGATQARIHVHLRALHGGEIVDYWADPAGGSTSISEQDRGRRYPAAEVIGSGCTFTIEAAMLDDWVERKLTLAVQVAQQPRAETARQDQPLTSATPGNIVATTGREHYTDGEWPLDWTMLKRAQLLTSSTPPPPPTDAEIDYAMSQADAAATRSFATATGPTLSFVTGDGRVEILIRPPKQDDDRTTVVAYNVYGMWENSQPATQPFFDDPNRQPTLAELRPWLITRRYSYQRDLKEAFPDVAGGRHPNVVEILNQPPWQPVLRRPERVADRTEGANDTLPNLQPPGTAMFGFDLRKGMRSDAGAPVDLFVGWDLAAFVDATWTPERRRDGTALPENARRPQAYRFWVTSVDAFEQESDPVPVMTNDVDAGETAPTYLFHPCRRAPLLGPPGADGTNDFALNFDPTTRQLSVVFETPWEVGIAGRIDPTSPSAVPPRVDKRQIEATVAIWRRRLTRKIETLTPTRVQMRSAAELPALPQWIDLAARLRDDGWRLHRVMSVAAPASGDLWTTARGLGENDSGWEYVAGVGFSVVEEKTGFWAPNVLATGTKNGRRAVLAKRLSDGEYVPQIVRVNETPQASDVATTNAVAIPNEARARAPALDGAGTRIWPAHPIPPPPGVRRDLVLLRLLTQGFVRDGVPQEPEIWRDTDVALTLGQAAMCDAAIERTPVDGKPMSPDDPGLATLRQLLAASLRKIEGVERPLQQHATAGFRGLLDLRWSYTPLEVSPPAPQTKEAEAVRFRIFAALAPGQAALARNHATLSGTGQLAAADEYEFQQVTGDGDGWQSVATLEMPTLARITRSDSEEPVVHGHILSAEESDGRKRLSIWSSPPGQKLPAQASIALFVAQPLAEIDATELDAVVPYRLLLPIGGGQPEHIAWWIAGISAQGKPCHRREMPFVTRALQSTLEPPAPLAFHLSVPTDFTEHMLDPASFRKWLPSDLATADDARFLPRLVLTWEAYDRAFCAALIVEREERQVTRPSTQFIAAMTARTPWQAIKALEAAPEGSDLDAADLDAIRDNWLVGDPVDIENGGTDIYEHVGRDPDRRLPADSGLKFVPSEGAIERQRRPGFIDYYGRNGDSASVMDASWEFRYRLRAFLDLGETLPNTWRYLLSRPTEWSPWLLPETPPLRVTCYGQPSAKELSDITAPRIRLRFMPGPAPSASPHAMRLLRLPAERRWEYRLLVRRRLDVPRPSTGGDVEPIWIDVGEPVRLSSAPKDLLDLEVDRAWPSHKPIFRYRVLAQQFLIIEMDDGQIERPVRGFDTTHPDSCSEFDLEIAAPTDIANEVEMTHTLYVT